MSKLLSTLLDVPEEVISLVARRVATTEKMGVKVKWLHRAIGDIYK